ncbi:MAG: hypothetical protein ACI9R3_004650 [Verrucomicrobiales bacterium]
MFYPYSGGEGKWAVNIDYSGSRVDDFAAANKAAGFGERARDTPDGFTWHHHEEIGRMELIRSDVHGDFPHSGGVSKFKELTGEDYD